MSAPNVIRRAPPPDAIDGRSFSILRMITWSSCKMGNKWEKMNQAGEKITWK
jgi:hypothetical protein